MKFKFNTSDLATALGVVSIVSPREVMPGAGAGYLFLVRGERCFVYSRDTTCVARADFAITDVEGEGIFVYPAAYINALKANYLGDTCTLESTQDGDNFKISYEGSSGAKDERMTFDPKLLSTCDQDLAKAEDKVEFPAGILREAIGLAKPFLADSKEGRVEEQFKGLQIFDKNKPDYAKGDGYLYASNTIQTCYFQCDAFMGKQLEMHGLHLQAFVNFLSKSKGDITVCRGTNFAFAVNSAGDVYGWPRQAKSHGKFVYYGLKNDQYVLSAPKSRFENALGYTRATLDAKRDKIKVNFDPERKVLLFSVADGSSKSQSFPVSVTVEQALETNITWNVNIDHLMSLVNGVKGNEVQLRVAMVKNADKEVAMFRTIDDFRMTPDGKVVIEPEGSFQCRVTRFMPSKD